jgi:hypothetical protein
MALPLTIAQKTTIRSELRAAGVSSRGLTMDVEFISALHNAGLSTERYGHTFEEDVMSDEETMITTTKKQLSAAEVEEAIQANTTRVNAVEPTDKMQQIAALLASLATNDAPTTSALDETAILALIEKHAIKSVVVKTPTEGATIKFDMAHPVLPDVIAELSVGNYVYLTGGAGSGKTTIAAQASESLGLDFYSKGACNAAYELVGVIDAHGNYNDTDLYKCWTEGGCYLFDEIDSYSDRALVALNQLLANDSFSFPNGMQKKHPNCVFIGAGNTTGQGATMEYVGRVKLDGSTTDRFFYIHVDYCQKLERALAMQEYIKFEGDNREELNAWVDTVQRTRARLAEHGLKIIVSPRASIMGARSLGAGCEVNELITGLLTRHMSKEQEAIIMQ